MDEKIWIRISQIQDGGVTILRKFFSKSYIFLNDGFPNMPFEDVIPEWQSLALMRAILKLQIYLS